MTENFDENWDFSAENIVTETHHIVPVYKCKELGIDPEFDGNKVEDVLKTDHALIHWGYYCDDLEPLFKYVIPEQWIIDLIPRKDPRDGAVSPLIARGVLEGTYPLSGEENPNFKHGKCVNMRFDTNIRAEYDKHRATWPEYKKSEALRYKSARYKEGQRKWEEKNKEKRRRQARERYRKASQERKDQLKRQVKERRERIKAEKMLIAHGVGSLEEFFE